MRKKPSRVRKSSRNAKPWMLFGLALALSCASTDSPDPKLQEAARLEVLRARGEARWFAATGRHPAPYEIAWGRANCEPWHWACFEPSTRRIWIGRDVPAPRMLDIVTHEIGHALGASHHKRYGIMNAGPCITRDDFELVRRPEC